MNNCHTGRPDTAIGIMSGTSIDGIDAVLVRFSSHASPDIIDTESIAYSDDLALDVIKLTQPGDNEIDRAGALHIRLGECYGELANTLASRNPEVQVDVIGCHGQTVRHRPNAIFPFTLQLGSGAVIARKTTIPTVSDFRSADMAAGGQGAPFAPFFHHAFFRSDEHYRAIINLGGIANITLLPYRANEPVTGFDSGPANGLMDAWIQTHRGLPFDEAGRWAASGRIHQSLLARLMAHPYLKRSAPKSTGREEFHKGWLDETLLALGEQIVAADVQRTLAEYTAQSIAAQLPECVEEIYVCGGGADNRYLLDRLADCTGLAARTTSELGIPPRWVETSAFAWIALRTLQHLPCTLQSVTGADSTTVCGSLYYVGQDN